MADKKLNEVTKVTDMAYVPVIMSDGSIGQIAKADLATVVAGVIPKITWNADTDISQKADFTGIKYIALEGIVIEDIAAVGLYGAGIFIAVSGGLRAIQVIASNHGCAMRCQSDRNTWVEWKILT